MNNIGGGGCSGYHDEGTSYCFTHDQLNWAKLGVFLADVRTLLALLHECWPFQLFISNQILCNASLILATVITYSIQASPKASGGDRGRGWPNNSRGKGLHLLQPVSVHHMEWAPYTGIPSKNLRDCPWFVTTKICPARICSRMQFVPEMHEWLNELVFA